MRRPGWPQEGCRGTAPRWQPGREQDAAARLADLVSAEAVDRMLADADAAGVSAEGLLGELTRTVLERALGAETTGQAGTVVLDGCGIICQVADEERREPSQATGTAALAAGWSHGHRDVSGGWLRPTVFGAVDGLVTNASLIAGLGGAGAAAHTIVLTGAAALVAGAFSMATGEYISVTNQNELVHAEVALERQMLARFPAAEQDELAGYFRQYGADPDTAARMAAAVSRDPSTALRVHTREELGVDHTELPSPILAGVASLLAFSLGALLPLLPYLVGLPALAVTLAITAVALITGGMIVGRLTGRPLLRSGLRQLALGALSIAVTFGVGSLIGGRGA
jgi:VIT1/CCC1 family predicted Fe2+/Mn2+ transporter